MPSRKSRIPRKNLKREIVYKPDIITNDANFVQGIKHSSIRLNKGNRLVKKQELLKFSPLTDEGVMVKVYINDYIKLKDLYSYKGITPVQKPDKLYSMSYIWDKCSDLRIVSNVNLKNMIADKNKRVEFIKDALARKQESDDDIKNGDNSISYLCYKWCKVSEDLTHSEISGLRRQINSLIEFLYVASCGRVDLTTPNIRDKGSLDMLSVNKLKFYVDVEQQLDLLRTIGSNDNRRKFDYTKGEFKVVDV